MNVPTGPQPPTAIAPLATLRNATPFPFCPGCGHHSILEALDRALAKLELDPGRTVMVTDIGCSGLSDQYFVTGAFHGLHGRSLTYAAGIKLARPELDVIVVLGDGGCGIGGAHLLAAARRNLDLTVLVFDNFNFGMTGGQHSTTTPPGAITSTTPGGNLERPMDIAATVAANGAGYVYRGTSFDPDLDERIAEAIRHPGFALLDLWEPCTAYFAPKNRLNRKAITEWMDRLGFQGGLVARNDHPEYGAAYRAAAEAMSGPSAVAPDPVEPRFAATLDRPFHLVLAGSAGGRVGSAARLIARAALLSGLFAAQRNDYPVTVRTGFSLAEILLSPEPIDDASGTRPDALVLLSPEGRKRAGRYLAAMGSEGRVFRLPEIELPAGAAAETIDPASSSERIAKDALAIAVACATVARLGLLPEEALLAAAVEPGSEAAVRAGFALAGVAS